MLPSSSALISAISSLASSELSSIQPTPIIFSRNAMMTVVWFGIRCCNKYRIKESQPCLHRISTLCSWTPIFHEQTFYSRCSGVSTDSRVANGLHASVGEETTSLWGEVDQFTCSLTVTGRAEGTARAVPWRTGVLITAKQKHSLCLGIIVPSSRRGREQQWGNHASCIWSNDSIVTKITNMIGRKNLLLIKALNGLAWMPSRWDREMDR